ncbi:Lrp/AsnC family transcriptional regulator [Natrinema salaciae]|uniref:DNA-binding transcriptional regulator, Lrp family n=1 Tax=Natrinema salaciae TaxID=1186196 RepID=A0A1H9H2P1_9EURY|nr:Lrp/AsnC family transcriptional regulator [Natrinema salaciae]SEQ56592.1 DNA-binding transcriptional regulator, Lrp family [Natrinema salaciae]
MAEIDRIDMAILHALQDDARNATTESIGERVDLASSSVATRINDLEENGVITGYTPVIDYDEAGFEQRLLLVGTVQGDDEGIVAAVSDVENVISVERLLTDEGDLHIELVSRSQERAEAVTDDLHELGVEITKTSVVVEETNRPFNHLGAKYTNGE